MFSVFSNASKEPYQKTNLQLPKSGLRNSWTSSCHSYKSIWKHKTEKRVVPSAWTSLVRYWNFPISADISVKVDNQTAGWECWLRCWPPRNELKFPDTHSHSDLLPNTADNCLNSTPAFNILRICLTFWNKKQTAIHLDFLKLFFD